MALPVCFEVNPIENLHGFSNLCSLSRPRAVYRHRVWFHRHVHTAGDRRIKWCCLSVQGYAPKIFFYLFSLHSVQLLQWGEIIPYQTAWDLSV